MSIITISQETDTDKAAISDLIDLCFGKDRKKRTVYQFRDGISAYESLCLCARNGKGDLVGSLRFWPVLLPNGGIIPLFGPLAVDPTQQGQGIGKALIQAGHQLVKEKGFKAILIIGKPSYYQPFGYGEEVISKLALPGPVDPLTFMGYEIEEGYLSKLEGPVRPVKI